MRTGVETSCDALPVALDDDELLVRQRTADSMGVNPNY